MAHYQREASYQFEADAERIWPAIARTNLVNELAGADRYEAVDELQPDGSVLRRARGDKLQPIAREWTEDLGEWVHARFCRQRRWFVPDGSQFLEYAVRLEPMAAGTRAHIRVEIEVASLLGWLGIRLGMVDRAVTKMIAAQVGLIEAEIRRSAQMAAETGAEADPLAHLPLAPPRLERRAETRLGAALERLRQLTGDAELPDRLADYLIRAPADFLGRIRPLEMARAWRAAPARVVDLCLAAHHAQLLSLRWEILCPRCRSSQTPAATLDALPRQLHCTTCNVDYERDFSTNVELLFAPEPWLRPLPEGAACMLGAASTPHIVVQRHVAPGASLDLDPPLHQGAYRVRAPQLEGQQREIDWDGESGFPEVTAEAGRLLLGAPAAPGRILLHNRTAGRVTMVVEELAWRRDALTGDQAIALPAFQRYCPDQLLRPGDEVRIANVVLMFTDLKGSTSLYEAIGDSAAYNLVRDHFDYLQAEVERQRGRFVKTMGDAIIAAFADPTDATRAAINLQTGIADFNRDRTDGGIILKLGLHQGACIAVTADNRLDYFGSMVNLAARLQGQSQGGDIVFSTDLVAATDPRPLIPPDQPYDLTQTSSPLRGFTHPITYWRLTLQEPPMTDAA